MLLEDPPLIKRSGRQQPLVADLMLWEIKVSTTAISSDKAADGLLSGFTSEYMQSKSRFICLSICNTWPCSKKLDSLYATKEKATFTVEEVSLSGGLHVWSRDFLR